MRQRLALERALIHDPRLVLFDEPFTGLDEASGLALIERLRALRAAGRIVLVATHDLNVAEGLIDRAVFLQAGRLCELDGVGALRDRYRVALAAPARGRRSRVRPDAGSSDGGSVEPSV